MNETIKNIMTRRSIREYKSEQITDEQLNIILNCAKNAPTGCNKQPWYFIVVQNKELIGKMSRLCFDENKKKGYPWYQNEDYYSPFYDAPTVIFVLRESKSNEWSYFDCSLATGNIVLAAKSLGLGSCILADAMTLFDKDFKETYYTELNIPSGYVPHIAIAIGYANEQPEEKILKENDIDIIK
ncbi:MAG: nitroreductase [Clostridia bacterium]|nr:nitroreductase [Clostridia bacterium]